MEMRETFKKSDLKTGMVVECRNGNKYTVMLDTVMIYNGAKDVLVGVEDNYSWMKLNDDYDDNLYFCKYEGDTEDSKDYDIMKVYQPSHCYSFVASSKLNKNYCVNEHMLIWERKKRTDFLDDKEAMIDFLNMGKSQFLFLHWSYTEEMYENTKALVQEKLGLC